MADEGVGGRNRRNESRRARFQARATFRSIVVHDSLLPLSSLQTGGFAKLIPVTCSLFYTYRFVLERKVKRERSSILILIYIYSIYSRAEVSGQVSCLFELYTIIGVY